MKFRKTDMIESKVFGYSGGELKKKEHNRNNENNSYHSNF
jgi:hypothetical protein